MEQNKRHFLFVIQNKTWSEIYHSLCNDCHMLRASESSTSSSSISYVALLSTTALAETERLRLRGGESIVGRHKPENSGFKSFFILLSSVTLVVALRFIFTFVMSGYSTSIYLRRTSVVGLIVALHFIFMFVMSGYSSSRYICMGSNEMDLRRFIFVAMSLSPLDTDSEEE